MGLILVKGPFRPSCITRILACEEGWIVYCVVDRGRYPDAIVSCGTGSSRATCGGKLGVTGFLAQGYTQPSSHSTRRHDSLVPAHASSGISCPRVILWR